MNKHHVQIPEEYHSLLKFRQNDLPGVATVNAALKAFEPKAVFAWHLSVLIECEGLGDNQLPSQEEQEVLYQFEDELDPKIKAGGNALFLARITHGAQRELIWRVFDPEPAAVVLREVINSGAHPRAFDFRMEEDKTWDKAAWYLENVQVPDRGPSPTA